ncbi:MAG: pitrilysin family protein [Polyangiaceae bacterium]
MTTRVDLPAGATLFVEESFAVPLVSISFALRTGSAQDPPGKEGLARIAMRMLRRGAAGMTSPVIEDAIDRLGAEMAVDTGASSVAMHAQVIARSLDAFVDLLTNLVTNPTFPEDEFERLRRETLAEIVESRDNDKALCQSAFRKALFPGHAYGRGGTGTKASVASLTLDDVRGFYAKHLVQGNVVIGMSGAVSTADAEVLAKKLLAGRPASPAVPDEVPEPTGPVGRSLVFVDKPERTQTQILVGCLGSAPRDPDHTAFGIANAIFGGRSRRVS